MLMSYLKHASMTSNDFAELITNLYDIKVIRLKPTVKEPTVKQKFVLLRFYWRTCRRPSVCRLSVCNVRAPYSGD